MMRRAVGLFVRTLSRTFPDVDLDGAAVRVVSDVLELDFTNAAVVGRRRNDFPPMRWIGVDHRSVR